MLYQAPEGQAKRFNALSGQRGPAKRLNAFSCPVWPDSAFKCLIRFRRGGESVQTLNQAPDVRTKRLNAFTGQEGLAKPIKVLSTPYVLAKRLKALSGHIETGKAFKRFIRLRLAEQSV